MSLAEEVWFYSLVEMLAPPWMVVLFSSSMLFSTKFLTETIGEVGDFLWVSDDKWLIIYEVLKLCVVNYINWHKMPVFIKDREPIIINENDKNFIR